MSPAFQDQAAIWWPFVFILLAGAIPTDIWRWLGVMAGNRIDENSEPLRWIKAVATALIAGVIGKLILFPTGSLAEASLALRVGSAAVGTGAFFLGGKSVFVGVLAGEAVFIAGWLANS